MTEFLKRFGIVVGNLVFYIAFMTLLVLITLFIMSGHPLILFIGKWIVLPFLAIAVLIAAGYFIHWLFIEPF